MRTYLVTGGAGFIGSNYIHYMFEKYGDDIRIINVDALTYAGNLENLKDVENRDNYTFVKADICDKEAIAKIFAENDIDRFATLNAVPFGVWIRLALLAHGDIFTNNIVKCCRTIHPCMRYCRALDIKNIVIMGKHNGQRLKTLKLILCKESACGKFKCRMDYTLA